MAKAKKKVVKEYLLVSDYNNIEASGPVEKIKTKLQEFVDYGDPVSEFTLYEVKKVDFEIIVKLKEGK